MKRTVLLMMALLSSAPAFAQLGSMPDPAVFPYTISPFASPDFISDFEVSQWKEFNDLTSLNAYVTNKKVRRNFKNDAIVIVTETMPVSAGDGTLTDDQIAQTKVVSGRAYRDRVSGDVVYLGCLSKGCKTHRAIVRTEDADGKIRFKWQGNLFSVRQETITSLKERLAVARDQKIELCAWYGILYLTQIPLTFDALSPYLKSARVLSGGIPSAALAASETPLIGLAQSGWHLVSEKKYGKIARALGVTPSESPQSQ